MMVVEKGFEERTDGRSIDDGDATKSNSTSCEVVVQCSSSEKPIISACVKPFPNSKSHPPNQKMRKPKMAG